MNKTFWVWDNNKFNCGKFFIQKDKEDPIALILVEIIDPMKSGLVNGFEACVKIPGLNFNSFLHFDNLDDKTMLEKEIIKKIFSETHKWLSFIINNSLL